MKKGIDLAQVYRRRENRNDRIPVILVAFERKEIDVEQMQFKRLLRVPYFGVSHRQIRQ